MISRLRWLALISVLAGCQGGHEAAAPGDAIEIITLSNRADLLSAGDALVEIRLPAGLSTNRLGASLNGVDISDTFARRSNGQIIGLVNGLRLGENRLQVTLGQRGAELTLTNHPAGGPVFSGPQVPHWTCANAANGLPEPDNDKCEGASLVEYFYKSSVSGRFSAYDPANPPVDLAMTTTDEGRSVPYIVRAETGPLNRGLYTLAVLHDPAAALPPPWQEKPGFNHKLVAIFGGGCAPNHVQLRSSENTQEYLDDAALSRGFAVVTSGMMVFGHNCNDVTSAETLMMVKEHVIETLGELRYTIGQGCSGGSIQQVSIAANYPGLLDAIRPACSFPDMWNPILEAEDCYLLDRVFDEVSPTLWASPLDQTAVLGYASVSTCRGLYDSELGAAAFAKTWMDPANDSGCLGGLANADAPLADVDWVYDPTIDPGGERCTVQDFQRAVFGERSRDNWGSIEQALGRGFANRPFDNVGVLYGLLALERGDISTEQFVDLNENVGGLDIDWHWQSRRSEGDADGLRIAHASGRLTNAARLAEVPIIDLRGSSNFDIHTDHHSYVMRARLVARNGTSDNQIIWTSDVPITGDPAKLEASLVLADAWVSAIKTDSSNDPLALKVLRHKPVDASDACWIGGQRIDDATTCAAVFPHYSAPRLQAGAPAADNILKCTLKPLERQDFGVNFSDSQWARLEAAFPDGVCDYSRPDPYATTPPLWLSFANGPGGQPLGEAPRSHALPETP